MSTNLVDQGTTMEIVLDKNLRPEIKFTTLHKIARLLLEHRILIGDRNQFLVTETFGIRDIRQVRITSLTETTNNKRIV